MESNLVQREKLEEWRLLRDKVLRILQARKWKNVEELVDTVMKSDPSVNVDEVREVVESLEDEGSLTLVEPAMRGSFFSYLTRNYKFAAVHVWLSLITISLALITIYLLPNIWPLQYFRLVAGGIVVLLLPGFGLVGLLFPRKDIGAVEQIGMSIGTSLALVPILWLILSYSPFGVGLNSMVWCMSAASAILILTSSYRQFLTRKQRSSVS